MDAQLARLGRGAGPRYVDASSDLDTCDGIVAVREGHEQCGESLFCDLELIRTTSVQELVPDTSTAAAWAPPKAVRPKPKRATNAAVRKQADFRNQAFLNNFISEVAFPLM